MIKREKWADHSFNFGINPSWDANLIARLSDTDIRLRYHLNDLTNEQLSFGLNDQWSVKQHLEHLTLYELIFIECLNQFKREAPVLTLDEAPFLDEKNSFMRLDELLFRFENRREKLLDNYRSFTTEERHHEAFHPTLKQVMKPVDLLFYIAEHDDYHLAAIQYIGQYFHDELKT